MCQLVSSSWLAIVQSSTILRYWGLYFYLCLHCVWVSIYICSVREAGRLGKGWSSGEPALGVMQCTRSVKALSSSPMLLLSSLKLLPWPGAKCLHSDSAGRGRDRDFGCAWKLWQGENNLAGAMLVIFHLLGSLWLCLSGYIPLNTFCTFCIHKFWLQSCLCFVSPLSMFWFCSDGYIPAMFCPWTSFVPLPPSSVFVLFMFRLCSSCVLSC